MKESRRHNAPGNSRLRWLALLMSIAILGISGFQVFWLIQNYRREERSLALKTETIFRETIMRLQASKLNLDFTERTHNPGVRVLVDNKNGHVALPDLPGKEEMVSRINVIRDKMMDSLQKTTKENVVITLDNKGGDTMRVTRRFPRAEGKDYIFDLLYGVDSLQDTIKVQEVKTAYARHLKRQKLNIPFTVVRSTYSTIPDSRPNQVTVGFAKPVTYQLQLGNTFPYLMRQILQPLLFSLLLLGVTILSFVLLYKNLLKQQRLAELKNEFISNITHELKTPIATVGVAIEALKNFNAIEDPARTREYLDISSNELHRLGLLVDKVLKLSMFEKMGIDLKYEPLDLRALVDEVVASLKLQLEKYKATVTITQEGETGFQGDRLHMVSVIFNLLDNALKYSKDEADIRIHLEGDSKNVTLRVEDNGIGIPAVYQDRIFDKFFRVPHGDTHNAKGYGLGLSYVAQVVQKHQGRITVNSEEGKGTAFTIVLPRNPGE